MKKILSVLLIATMLLAALGMFSASAASDKVLEFTYTPGGESPIRYIVFATNDITVPDGATFEYDVYLKDDIAGIGTVNVSTPAGKADMRDAFNHGEGVLDQNSLGSHPKTDISDMAYGKWYHRVFKMENGFPDGGSIDGFLIAAEASEAGTCYFDNIVLKNADGTILYTFFDDTTDMNDYNDGKDDTTGTSAYTLNVIDNPYPSEQQPDNPVTDPSTEPVAPPQTADFSAAIVACAVLALGAAVVLSKKH